MSRAKKPVSFSPRLGLEQLEARSMLSGIHDAAVSHLVKAHDHHPAIVAPSHSSSSSSKAHAETHLTAALSDPANPAFTGNANFESKTEHGVTVSKLSISVQGGTAGDQLPLSIVDTSGNTFNTTLTIGADGTARLCFSSNPHGASGQAFPANFPTIAAGTMVTVDNATGTFAASTHGSDHGSHDHGGQHQDTNLVATLADPNNSATTGFAHFESSTEHGLTVSEFSLRFQGGNPGDQLAVSIDDGNGNLFNSTLTVGTDGTARLCFSSNPHDASQQAFPAGFPTIAAGTVITVNGTPFTFAIPSQKSSK